MLVFWSSMIPLSAQITLHEATNVTQTKATLSADFPDLNSEHGFQYKYGSLPEVDDFSKLALATYSEPISLQSINWHSVTNEGYVETYSGQSGTITAKITLYQPSKISFDWSIDAQDGCAYLRFSKESGLGSSSGISYIEVSRISGDTPFTTYESSELSAGTHYLKWEYVQIKPSSIGLDIARIKNINIQNASPGMWQSVQATDFQVSLIDLVPMSSVMYRAYTINENGFVSSGIKSFNTDPVQITQESLTSVTQTTATISRPTGYCEAQLSKGVNYTNVSPLLIGLTAEDTDCSNIQISGSSAWHVESEVLMCNVKSSHDLYLTFEIEGEKYSRSKVEFDYSNNGTYHSGCYFGLFIDADKNVKKTHGKGSGHYVFELGPGKHTLHWKAERWNSSAAGGTVTLSNLKIENIVSAKQFNTVTSTSDETLIPNLKPDNYYMAQSFVCPSNILNDTEAWKGNYSEWFRIKTLPVVVKAKNTKTTQTSFTIEGEIDRGDAATKAIGIQYKAATNNEWIDFPIDNSLSSFSHKVTRLKPSASYNFRTYALVDQCDSTFSEIQSVTTASVEAIKPVILSISQHEVKLQGKVIFGDANIYQRGMQFRKKETDKWEEVEDGGNDSIYTLVKKNLEMGAAYQARTYVQPAGCDIIYSDILEFNTLDNYFKGYLKSPRTQTTVEFSATLAELDENITAEEYGFEYYFDSDGFFENASGFVKSDIIRVPVVPENGQIKTTITGLTPSYGLRFRAYTKIHGVYIYYTGYKDWKWDFAGTERATISVTVKKITQTSISLALDAKQNGDAQVSQIEYALANSVEETLPYSLCGNTLTLSNLIPDKQYNLRFRGLVNDRYCPLLKEISWDYSWFEYNTLPVDVNVVFSNITQTKAKMNVDINAGDATVSNLKYQIGNGDIKECSKNNLLTDLMPGQTYAVTIYANINGEELSWNTNASEEPFKFTTKTVSSYISISDISQTSAKLKCSSNFGDATYLSSGLEFGGIIFNSENQDFEEIMTELLPGKSYSCRSFVETKESGRVYSSSRTFTTKNIECETRPVSNISNRSATMNGTIDCDSYSSAEFGFQWKQMEGWQSEPAFTKGRKLDDGTISVALTNGMLEPNTDYQYRAAVRYQDHIYYAPNWITFRTESEFVYYPASVYTVFRTDRENNTLVLCGYYVAGSETIVSQGYEYWQTSKTHLSRAPQSPTVITTDESMHHLFAVGEIPSGNYNVRAFVKTETGTTIYGATLSFSATSDGYSGIAEIKAEQTSIATENGIVKLYNATGLDCFIYSLSGQIIANKKIDSPYYEVRLTPGNFYIVTLSNGITKKVKL